MKAKIKMTCIMKSGAKVEDTLRVSRKDKLAFDTISRLRKEIEKYMTSSNPGEAHITWGTTTIRLSEVAAISFKD